MRLVNYIAMLPLLLAGVLAFPAGSQPTLSVEQNVNRPGSDYNAFDLPSPDPNICRNACAADARCAAYTYVRPGIQSRAARCWLKNAPAAARAEACCVSGVKSGGPVTGLEYDVNRPGGDFSNFDVRNDPMQCRNACAADGRCQAFTFVKPGVQGASARCWLKTVAPAPRSEGCCISGLIAGRGGGVGGAGGGGGGGTSGPPSSTMRVFNAVPQQPSSVFQNAKVSQLSIETGYDRTPYLMAPPFSTTVTLGSGRQILLAGDQAGNRPPSVDNFFYVQIGNQRFVIGAMERVSDAGGVLQALPGDTITDLSRYFQPGAPTPVTIMALDYGGFGRVSDVFLVVR